MASLPLLSQNLWQVQQSLTLFNSLISVFLLLFISILFLKKFAGGNTKLNLPPSPPKLPIIGNLHQLGTLPHRSLPTLSKKYGPVVLMHLGHMPTLLITSAEIVKEMVKTHDAVFSSRPILTFTNILFYGCIEVGFAPYDDNWRQARKVCVSELLNLKRVQSFQFVRDEEVAVLIERIRRSCQPNGASVNLTEMLLDVSSNILSRCVIGRKCVEEGGKNNFGKLSRKLVVQCVSFSFGDFFPSLGWLDRLTGLISRLKETFKELESFFDQVIEEHKILNSDMDFVDILLQLQRDGLLNFDLTRPKLKALLAVSLSLSVSLSQCLSDNFFSFFQLQDMFVAAIETSSTTMEWAMAELIRNPATLKKAQEEVRRVVGKKSKIDVTDINQMDYLKCVIKEALRVHPPAPLLVPRETLAAAKLGGYDILPKTRVLINSWAIQRDPELWDRAEEFIPERFENNPVDFKGQDFQFTPFGIGRRGCPGIYFGVASIECVLSNLLYWFDLSLPDDVTPESLDMSERYGFSVHMKVPLHLVPAMHSP